MDAEVITKTCSKCRIEKLENDFSKNRSRKDRLNAQCRLCVSKNTKKYIAKNKAKIAERDKKYYAKNKEKITEYKKKYQLKNREKTDKASKKYYAKNKAKVSERYKKKYSENKEKFRELHKQYRSKNKIRISEAAYMYRSELRNHYIRAILTRADQTLKQAQIPQSLINLKREEIKIKRLIKEMTQ